ncbi:superoxide dismutase [Candidatus Berkelbacteria bacterium CG10_big_fil_rev_8_21_14_0_10_43_13]|uniref:Superoxide dismutase n=1 Tax=Candidatus Berkelbacteria bacterium CG10_big_fil_rev_8_21_14_0_10_43_13 TaxID=1974514 RepID=A0A2H0W5U3_9BACT|nr:MAG: superoxide dismutase [Candidatus Berkelbacteria bacterium CG10_big_fil_rev_8_21_14_0_10_43_13]
MIEKNYTLPDLPYAYDALEPVISKEIMTLHHDKHHKGYVDKANELLQKLADARKSGGKVDIGSTAKKLSFNIDGHRLHTLFWTNLTPVSEKKEPSHELLSAIEAEFGDLEQFKPEFTEAATTIEGSGWATLAVDPETGRLIISQVGNHNLAHTLGPILLVSDMWEHAFYLDYKSDKKTYASKFWDIVNWQEVSVRFDAARKLK